MSSTKQPLQLSNLDVLNICDNFCVNRPPPRGHTPSPFDSDVLIPWRLTPSPTSPIIGLLRQPIVAQLHQETLRSCQYDKECIWDIQSGYVSFAAHISTPPLRTSSMAELCTRWRDEGLFSDVIGPEKWRDERYPVYANPFGVHDCDGDATGNWVFEMERSACQLFGVVTYGVHMTIFGDSDDGIRIWVPRRSRTKPTFPGYLDNTVAGGTPSGMSIFTSLVKESMEEASISEGIIRTHAKSCGAISYFFRNKAGWLQPEIEYVYDLRIPPEENSTPFQPKPLDGEVESFEYLPLEDVISRMRNGEFKPNTALVILDFLIRHGYLTPENEPDFMEILTRLHGRFDFDRWGI